MVRHLTRPARSWKAKLAMIVAAGVIASHIMACVESPMSFSPTGALAFSVWDPSYLEDGTEGAVFRVMILDRDMTLREIERSEAHLLSGPVFTADATQIAYLRIPIPETEEVDDVEVIEPLPETEVASPEMGPDNDETTEPEIVTGNWLFGFPVDWEDLPSAIIKSQSSLADHLREGNGIVEAELVFRDVAGGALVDTIPFALPQPDAEAFWIDYYFSKPAFSANATDVFLTAQGLIYALDINERRARVLGTALGTALSPDGRTLAGYEIDGKLLSLFATDASRVIHISLAHDIAPYSDAFWIDGNTIAVLGTDKEATYLDSYDASGLLVSSRMLDEDAIGGGDLALSPDGRFLTLVSDESVTFFSDKFIVLEQFEHEFEEDFFDAAVYTPDSQQVAFKHLVSEEFGEDGPEFMRTDAIVFFTPQGRELFRVDIPPVPKNLPLETDDGAANDTEIGEPQQ